MGDLYRSSYIRVFRKLGSTWFLVDCLDICTEDVCFGMWKTRILNA
jgi:hypothetical protein